MKKLLLFLTVLVFFGNTNAQEMRRQVSTKLETAKSVNPAKKIDNAEVKMSVTSKQEIDKKEVKSMTHKQKISRADTKSAVLGNGKEFNPVQRVNKAPTRAAGDVILSEGFETNEYDLPLGWTALNNSPAYPWEIVDWYDLWYVGIDTHSGDYCAIHFWTPDEERNNWLFSKGFNLNAGTTYQISFWLLLPGYLDLEDGIDEYDYFEAKIGQSASVAGMTTSVYVNTDTRLNDWTEITYNFTPTTSGTYYIGFHAFTPTDEGDFIGLDDVLIAESAAIDAAITAITAPVSGINLTATETVTATIKNNGTTPITTIDLELTVDGNTPVVETYTVNIAAGATATYTFTAKADLSTAGNHTVAVRAILIGDENSDNDSKTITILNIVCSSITSLPLTQDFEDNSYLCWTIISNNTENGIGGTGSYPMGVINNIGTNHVFRFSSFSIATDYNQYLITPELPVTSNSIKISFDYARSNTSGTELFRVGYSSTTNSVTAFTWGTQVTVTNTDPTFNEYSLNVPAGTKYIAIHYQSDYQYLLHIDNIVIEEVIGEDAVITAITAPVSGINLTATETVTATIKNNGTNPITTIDLELTVDGNTPVVETYPVNIASGATANYTFTAKADLSTAGNHTVAVRAILAGDGNAANDSKTITILNIVCNSITSLPLVQNFEDYSVFCWDMISNNAVNGFGGTGDYPMGLYYIDEEETNLGFLFSSYTSATDYNQYLITPELPNNNGLSVTFDYAAPFSEHGTESFRVGHSTTTNNPNAFIWSSTVTANSENFVQYSSTFPVGTKYIAINYQSSYEYVLLVDNIVIDEVPLPALDIASKTPAANATNVALDAEVSVTFNQNITAADLTGITIDNGITATASVEGNKLTIAHDAFVYETEYTVKVPAGAIIGYTNDIEWSFTTLDEPIIPIEIVTLTPEDDAVNVALDAEVSVTFSQNITDVDLSGISISDGTNIIAVTAEVSENKLIINHDDFAYSTTYTVNVPAGAIDGYDEDIEWSFTTTVQDNIPVVNNNEINIFQNNNNIFVTPFENSDVRLLDVLGRVLGSYNVAANATLTINQLSGIYLIEVRSNGNVSTHKIIVK